MKKIFSLLIFTLPLLACTSTQESNSQEKTSTESYYNKEFEIIKPENDTKAVLFLFPGLGESIEHTKKEFDFIELAIKNKIALVFMNFNDRLWLSEENKLFIGKIFQEILSKHNLENTETFIGGHSAGGSISLIITNFFKDNQQFGIDPKGVFIVDSPLDLLSMYRSCNEKIAKQNDDALTNECKELVNYFNNTLGTPERGISPYEKYSVYTLESKNIENISSLKSTKIRLYTEPDIEWWKTNYGVEYEETNAFGIKKLSEILMENNYKAVEYIATENKGYRSNGERHPHSWSIIDKKELIDWILKK